MVRFSGHASIAQKFALPSQVDEERPATGPGMADATGPGMAGRDWTVARRDHYFHNRPRVVIHS